MHWLNGVLATIGFFLLSVFGGQQAPVASPSIQSTHPLTNVVTVTSTEVQGTNTTKSSSTNLTDTITGSSGYVLENGQVFYYEVSTYGGEGTSTTSQVSKTEVVGADPSTFSVLDPAYAKDAHHFYADGSSVSLLGATPTTTVDLASLIGISTGYTNLFRDKNAVYIPNAPGDQQSLVLTKIPGADPASFEILPDPTYSEQPGAAVSYSSYAKDKNSIYFLSYPDGYDLVVTKIPGIDPDTFKVIGPNCTPTAEPSGGYGVTYVGRDARIVLAGSQIIPGTDPNTFAYVGSVALNLETLGGGTPTVYEKDENHVYAYCSDIVQGADPATFTIINPLPKPCSLLDIPKADGTFPTSEPGCFDSKDAQHEFLQGKMIKTPS